MSVLDWSLGLKGLCSDLSLCDESDQFESHTGRWELQGNLQADQGNYDAVIQEETLEWGAVDGGWLPGATPAIS